MLGQKSCSNNTNIAPTCTQRKEGDNGLVNDKNKVSNESLYYIDQSAKAVELSYIHAITCVYNALYLHLYVYINMNIYFFRVKM